MDIFRYLVHVGINVEPGILIFRPTLASANVVTGLVHNVVVLPEVLARNLNVLKLPTSIALKTIWQYHALVEAGVEAGIFLVQEIHAIANVVNGQIAYVAKF